MRSSLTPVADSHRPTKDRPSIALKLCRGSYFRHATAGGPYAAGLAADKRRGKVVGFVISGLLIGILLSRSLSEAN
jgi:hypothetical protein